MECIKEQKAGQALKFSSMNEAWDWIEHHRTEIAAGAVIVVAGAAFIVATGGSGAVLLVPLAL